MFLKKGGGDTCEMTRELLEEISGLSEKIYLEIYDLEKDSEKALSFGIEKAPGIALLNEEKDFGIRFFGLPSGTEFTVFIDDILDVSAGRVKFTDELTAELSRITSPAHLQVMISPQCPHCPIALRAAHRLAIACDQVSADGIVISEFPEVVEKLNVRSVPMTYINGKEGFVGTEPLFRLILAIEDALS